MSTPRVSTTPAQPTRAGAADPAKVRGQAPAPTGAGVDLDRVRRVAGGVKDPEVRTSIADLGLLDDATVNPDGHVTVRFHLTSPLCPAKFAGQIGQEIRRRVARIHGVTSVEVVLNDHYLAEALHQLINHGDHTAATKGVLR